MPGQVLDVRMPRHGPETWPARLAAIRVPVHGLVFAQPGELLVRRSGPLINVGVDEVDLRRHRLRPSPASFQEPAQWTIAARLVRVAVRARPLSSVRADRNRSGPARRSHAALL